MCRIFECELESRERDFTNCNFTVGEPKTGSYQWCVTTLEEHSKNLPLTSFCLKPLQSIIEPDCLGIEVFHLWLLCHYILLTDCPATTYCLAVTCCSLSALLLHASYWLPCCYMLLTACPTAAYCSLTALPLRTAHWPPCCYMMLNDCLANTYCSLTTLTLPNAQWLTCQYVLLTDCPATTDY